MNAIDLEARADGPVESASRKLRVLIITKLFPNAAEPLLAPFNRQQFAALSRHCDVKIWACLPWYPGARLLQRWSPAGRTTRVPRQEVIEGMPVDHPRVFYVPKIGHAFAGAFYAASLLPRVLASRGQFDVILGAWAYPDGTASVVLGRLLSVPVVVKVHGSDIDVLSTKLGPRKNLRWLLPRADAVVAVSRPLANEVAALGVRPDRITVIRNGVNTELFRPRKITEAREALGHGEDRRKWLAFVGLMVKDKGIYELLAAFSRIAARRTDIALVFVGHGAELDASRAEAASLGDRVIFAGGRPLAEIPLWMASAQAVVLPSHHEGTPNVLIEAMACGRRVVASGVGGIPDLITSKTLGELVPPRDVPALEVALERAADATYDSAAVAAAAAQHSWDDSAHRLHALLEQVVAERRLL
jgi:glycosyltransferase involved in cell wall biosynthesis